MLLQLAIIACSVLAGALGYRRAMYAWRFRKSWLIRVEGGHVR